MRHDRPSAHRLAKAVAALAAFFNSALAKTEPVLGGRLAEQNARRRSIEMEHVKIISTKAFAEVEKALEEAIPQLDPAIVEALAQGDKTRAEELARGSDLFIFLKRDHGALLRSAGQTRKAAQYEIGNPITASTMTQYQLPAALYAPLRVVLYEDAAGTATLEYDRPSTLFRQFGDPRVTAVGLKLDVEIDCALRQAAGNRPR